MITGIGCIGMKSKEKVPLKHISKSRIETSYELWLVIAIPSIKRKIKEKFDVFWRKCIVHWIEFSGRNEFSKYALMTLFV